jgi:hypothetical protein
MMDLQRQWLIPLQKAVSSDAPRPTRWASFPPLWRDCVPPRAAPWRARAARPSPLPPAFGTPAPSRPQWGPGLPVQRQVLRPREAAGRDPTVHRRVRQRRRGAARACGAVAVAGVGAAARAAPVARPGGCRPAVTLPPPPAPPPPPPPPGGPRPPPPPKGAPAAASAPSWLRSRRCTASCKTSRSACSAASCAAKTGRRRACPRGGSRLRQRCAARRTGCSAAWTRVPRSTQRWDPGAHAAVPMPLLDACGLRGVPGQLSCSPGPANLKI